MKPELEERKAGENVDGTQWKNTFQLEKGDEEFFSGTRVRNRLTVFVARNTNCENECRASVLLVVFVAIPYNY